MKWDYIGIRFDSCAAVRAVEPAAGSRSTAANLKICNPIGFRT